MADEVIAIMASLSAVMREETGRLQAQERVPDLAELASAKARLVGSLEERLARLGRQDADWAAQMDTPTRERFAETLGELRAASMVNAALLERQIELSADIMSAISAEARRVSGNRASTYGASGSLARSDLATPISLNGEF
ncbi:MAG TPA: flagellar biosynthesis protein FlgN [Novosphingobium sp.]|nr:flagellar biosynthesis protein FlgN [Novosphingobium sp.]